MNWTDQMQQFTRSWTEAQQKMASDWSAAMHKSATPGGTEAGDWAARWRDQAAANYDEYLAKLGGVPGSVAQRMFAGAQSYGQFVELIAGLLREMAPKMDAGGDWASALKKQFEALRGKLDGQPQLWMKPESMAAMTGDVAELWRLFLDQGKAVSAPWLQSVGQARGHLGEAMGGDHRAAIRMVNLFTDTFESTMGRFLGAPTIGYSREYQEKLTKTFEAWVEMKKAEVAFNTELTAIGFRALQALVERLQEMAAKGEKVESSRGLFDLWVDIAEKTYFEAASTEAFAQTQADLVNASMHHRVHERTLLEIFYKAAHLPTRKEIDDAYKHMHELRSQVKRLSKTAKALKSEVASLTESRQEESTATKAAAKASAALQAEITSLKEFRKTALTESRAAAKAMTALQAEVASLKEFRKNALAASRAAAKAPPAKKKAAAKKAATAAAPAAASSSSAGRSRTAKGSTATKTAPSKPAGARSARTKTKEA